MPTENKIVKISNKYYLSVVDVILCNVYGLDWHKYCYSSYDMHAPGSNIEIIKQVYLLYLNQVLGKFHMKLLNLLNKCNIIWLEYL